MSSSSGEDDMIEVQPKKKLPEILYEKNSDDQHIRVEKKSPDEVKAEVKASVDDVKYEMKLELKRFGYDPNKKKVKPLCPDDSKCEESSRSNLCCSTLIFVLGNAFAIASIAIGSVYIDQCPIERMIPIYLIVAGCASFLASTLSVIQGYGANHDCMGMAKAASVVKGMLSGFGVIWLIVGSVYTYRVYNDYTSTKQEMTEIEVDGPDNEVTKMPEDIYGPNYCNQVVYMYSFISITLAYCLILVGLVIGCCVCCCGGLLLCASKTSNTK